MSDPYNQQATSTISNTVKIAMLSIQLLLYIIVSVVCIQKTIKSWVHHAQFIKYFYPFVFLYIMLEIALQIYQLVGVIIEENSDQSPLNINMVISINIFCMITDIYIITMLSLYWKKIQNQFRSQARDSFVYKNPVFPKRFIAAIFWTLLYIGLFVYLNITGLSAVDMRNNQTKQILLYYVAQGVTVLIILCVTVAQTRRGMILLQTLRKYQSLISFPMNKTRFLIIFWMTSVFNVARMMFLIGVTTFYATATSQQSITNIWLEIYIFTFTAIFPISFYLFGFKVKENQQAQVPTIGDDKSPSKISNLLQKNNNSNKSKSKGSSSSYHQTQLAESF